MPDKIEIRLNKLRIARLMLGSAVFVAIGVWMLIHEPQVKNGVMNQPVVKAILATSALVFFGASFLIYLVKLINTKPALIIDDIGITDNTSFTSGGFIPWNDIDGFKHLTIQKQHFLAVLVKHPEQYLHRTGNLLVKKSMQWNLKQFGTPVTIPTRMMKTGSDELYTLLSGKLQARKNVHL